MIHINYGVENEVFARMRRRCGKDLSLVVEKIKRWREMGW